MLCTFLVGTLHYNIFKEFLNIFLAMKKFDLI